jgi:DDE superfamily endonuclease
MPRKRTLTEDEEWEQDVDDAVEEYKRGKYSSLREAARETGFSRTTLTARLNGRPTRRKAQEKNQNLSHTEEDEVVRAIRIATLRGKPLQPHLVRAMVEAIRKRRVKGVNENGIIVVDYEALGKKWLRRFKRRQRNLRTERVEKIEAVRNEVTAADLEKWFAELERVVRDFNILPRNIYNMDETGFNIGDFQARHVVLDTSVNSRYQAQPGRQEWLTSIECICADGSSISPLLIFTGETFVRQWVPPNFDSTWKFSNTAKGWTSNELAVMWLKQCFEPATRDKVIGGHRLLICDGHNSHCTADFLAHCIEHKILLFLLVPHSSHIVQPLDAGLFRVVKDHLSANVAETLELGVSRIQKPEWLKAYYPAHNTAFSVANIKSMFSSTGIYPFNPTKALDRFPAPQISPSTPRTNEVFPNTLTTTATMATTTSFPTQILTSSPSDFTVLQVANSALNRMIESENPLPTPARKFVRTLTTAAEKLFTRTSILQQRTEPQEALLAARQQRASGKRSVIKGKFLLSTPEIHSEVLQTEKTTAIKKKRQRKGDPLSLPH